MQFTPAQQEAIDHRGSHLQIIACAGSGKTQVTVERINQLLEEGLSPEEILAFTFTEKAAAELSNRIRASRRERGLDTTGLAEMYIGTIHGWCLDFLQSRLNRFLKYRVLNDPQTRLFIQRHSRKCGLTLNEYLTGTALTRNKYDVRNYQTALNILREDEVVWSEVPDDLQAGLAAYRGLLDEHALFDYTEMLCRVVEGLEHPTGEWIEAKRVLLEQVQHVLVDEYQDVNPIQERLIQVLQSKGACLTVVGDDDQTIYQFRGSDAGNILGFTSRYPTAKTVNVTTNFRSSQEIVETAEAVASLNTHRLVKRFDVGAHHLHEAGDIMALAFDDPAEEARYIAQRIEDMVGHPYEDTVNATSRGLAYSDFAVLLRSVKHSAGPIMEALRDLEIPFVVKGVQQLFERPEIRAVTTTFHYMAERAARPAVEAAWADAGLGLDDATISNAIRNLPELDDDESWALFNLQSVFLNLIESLGLTEDSIPDPRHHALGGVVFHNFGMFSQLITDFEQIHFKTPPTGLYTSFSYWLQNEAPDLYDEGGLEGANHVPNAVMITTVHQSKGLQWPAVFVPCLQRNRFPARKPGGRTVWHLLPETAVPDHERYASSEEDERRLFYVAITRAERFLYCSWAPGEKKGTTAPSQFMQEVMIGGHALTVEPSRSFPTPLPPVPRIEEPVVRLSFSEYKYWSECPYLFKLRFVYGFNPPVDKSLGYGKSIHDALAEAHRRAIEGEVLTVADIPSLMHHMHFPFAYQTLEATLTEAARKAVERYFTTYGKNLTEAIHSEQKVEFSPVPGLIVSGRIDLVTDTGTNTVRLIDFKSSDRAQSEDVTMEQLNIYAAGYRDLTGALPNYIEVINLDPGGAAHRALVDEKVVESTLVDLEKASVSIRAADFERLAPGCTSCGTCDLQGICGR